MFLARIASYVLSTLYHTSPQTIGASFKVAKVSHCGKELTLEIWDTSGQERYRSLTPMYYRAARIVVGVFDRNHMDTLDAARLLLSEAERNVSDVALILVENMIDLEDAGEQEVKDIYLEKVLADLKIPGDRYFRVSAKTGEGIPELKAALGEIGYDFLMYAQTGKEFAAVDNENAGRGSGGGGSKKDCVIC